MFVLNAYFCGELRFIAILRSKLRFLLRNTVVDSYFTPNFWGKIWRLEALFTAPALLSPSPHSLYLRFTPCSDVWPCRPDPPGISSCCCCGEWTSLGLMKMVVELMVSDFWIMPGGCSSSGRYSWLWYWSWTKYNDLDKGRGSTSNVKESLAWSPMSGELGRMDWSPRLHTSSWAPGLTWKLSI